MKTVAVIPARMGSSRFPGKPLANLLGRTMIEHVYKRTALSRGLSSVVVATCDKEIADAVRGFGGTAVMTSGEHERASDRVAEASGAIDADVIVMVQGDEPMVHPHMIDEALEPIAADDRIVCVNLPKRIEDEAAIELLPKLGLRHHLACELSLGQFDKAWKLCRTGQSLKVILTPEWPETAAV